MSKKKDAPNELALPVVNEPGTFAWCEEVVECINAAWVAREQGEQGFLAAIQAALEHRIWETLSPPPPQEPYTSLANLIRRTAPPGQAESMQLVIKFSGLEEASAAAPARAVAVDSAPTGEVSAPWADLAAETGEDPEAALGRRILEAFEAQLASGELRLPDEPSGYEPDGGDFERGAAASGPARMTPAQRKREKLAQTHPDLLDAVQSGAMSLKQAYVEAGIDKPPQTLDRLQKLWRTATEEEQQRFVSWVQEQVQKARKAEYEADVYGES